MASPAVARFSGSLARPRQPASLDSATTRRNWERASAFFALLQPSKAAAATIKEEVDSPWQHHLPLPSSMRRHFWQVLRLAFRWPQAVPGAAPAWTPQVVFPRRLWKPLAPPTALSVGRMTRHSAE